MADTTTSSVGKNVIGLIVGVAVIAVLAVGVTWGIYKGKKLAGG